MQPPEQGTDRLRLRPVPAGKVTDCAAIHGAADLHSTAGIEVLDVRPEAMRCSPAGDTAFGFAVDGEWIPGSWLPQHEIAVPQGTQVMALVAESAAESPYPGDLPVGTEPGDKRRYVFAQCGVAVVSR